MHDKGMRQKLLTRMEMRWGRVLVGGIRGAVMCWWVGMLMISHLYTFGVTFV